MRRILYIMVIYLFNAGYLYNQISVPDSLIENCDLIIVDKIIKVNIFDIYKVNTEVQIDEIVLKEDIDSYPEIVIPYDKFKKINDIEIFITDISGKKIKTLKRSDLTDQSTYDGTTIASDNKYLFYKSFGFKTPYRISIKYKEEINQSFYLPNFIINHNSSTYFQNGQFVINCYDKTNKIFVTNSKYFPYSTIEMTNYIEYKWVLSNLKLDKEDTGNQKEMKSIIQPYLNKFQMEGYIGSNDSWQTFGEWISKLNEGCDALNSNTTQEILAEIKGVNEPFSKVDVLYKYLQNKMRYVSIQLGIGGWKPMLAQDVHDNKYGDCKALSNYMKTILKIAGLESYYVLVKAGPFESLIADTITYNQFNHAILAVPLGKDTVFLECTASYNNGTGFQGGFTHNRNVLWVDGKNSKLVNTVKYNTENSFILNKFNFDLFNQIQNVEQIQTLHGNAVTHNGYYFSRNLNEVERKKYFTTKLLSGVSHFELIEANDIKNDKYPVVGWKAKYQSSQMITTSGKRIFVHLTGTSLSKDIEELKNNKKTLKITDGISITDTFEFMLPQQCMVERKPKNILFENICGHVSLKDISDKDGIKFISKIVLNEGEYFDGEVESFRTWMENYAKSKNEKITLVCENP